MSQDCREYCLGGAAPECDDGDPCTDDSCDASLGCLHPANTATCDDGDACTVGDVCVQANCQSGNALSCDDNNACTDDSCDDVTGCVYVAKNGESDAGDACT